MLLEIYIWHKEKLWWSSRHLQYSPSKNNASNEKQSEEEMPVFKTWFRYIFPILIDWKSISKHRKLLQTLKFSTRTPLIGETHFPASLAEPTVIIVLILATAHIKHSSFDNFCCFFYVSFALPNNQFSLFSFCCVLETFFFGLNFVKGKIKPTLQLHLIPQVQFLNTI